MSQDDPALTTVDERPPNHHAHHPQFTGLSGYTAALSMVRRRDAEADLVIDLAGVTGADVVLDIGCGPGTAVRRAASLGARAIGIDPSPPMLRVARLMALVRPTKGAVTWLTGPAERLAVDDDSVTVCWSIAAVHHWQDLEAGLDEVERVLKPGGRFVAVEKRTQVGATGKADHGWTPDQARRFAAILEQRGFSDVTVVDHQPGSRPIVIVQAVHTPADHG